MQWHLSPDIPAVRETVTSAILATFQRRRPDAASRDLPSFVKRLEEQLFQAAATKEEYADLNTLEARLQMVARRFAQNQRNHLSNGGAGGGGAGGVPGSAPGSASPAVTAYQLPGTPQMEGAACQPPQQQQLQQQQQQMMLQQQMLGAMAGQQQQFGGLAAAGMVPTGMGGMGMSGGGADGMQQQAYQQQQQQQRQQQQQLSPFAGGVKVEQAPGQQQQLPVGGVSPEQQQQQQYQQQQMKLEGDGGPQGMVSLDALGAQGASNNMYGQGGMMPTPGMVPTPGMAPSPGMGGGAPQLMSNGAPVLRKEQWGGTSGGMVPVGMGNGGMMGGVMMGMPGGQYGMGGGGMVPGGGFMPAPGGGGMGMQMAGGGMVPVNGPMGGPGGMIMMGAQQMANGMGGMASGMGGGMGGGMVGGMPGGMGSGMGSGMGGGMPGMAGGMGGLMAGPGGGFAPQGQPVPIGGAAGAGAMGGLGAGDPAAAGTQQQQQQQQGGGGQPQQAPGRTQYIQKQQRWLLFLRHCAKCTQSEAECQFSRSCRVGKELWQHILQCTDTKCPYPRCVSSKDLLKHHQKCQNPACPICTPVKEYVRRSRDHATSGVSGAGGAPGGGMGFDAAQAPAYFLASFGGQQAQQGYAQQQQQQQQQQFAQQQQQQQQQQLMVQQAARQQQMLAQQQAMAAQQAQQQQQQQRAAAAGQKRPLNGAGAGPAAAAHPLHPGAPGDEPKVKRSRQDEAALLARNTGTSLLETFEPGQLRAHVERVREEVARLTAKSGGGGGGGSSSAAAYADPKDVCTVCQQSKFTFEPPCLYCTQCGQRIRRGQTYYCTPPEYEIKGFWCHGCYSEHKGDRVPFDGSQSGFVRKSEIVKRKNDEEIEEYWVQCDCCEGWVHQICGLFNKGRNNANSTYLCPDCLSRGLAGGLRKRLEARPQSMLEASDLPHCALSRAIQARLDGQLAADRARRAAAAGLAPEQVPGAEGLTVRVINNVVKKCEVRPKFLEMAAAEGRPYPEALPYRQRVLLLYQRTDGVDVCLFCMYVQEYGADCPEPNRNVVYLSYLDSIKYFKPEINAAPASGGQSLRTFVYHQILLGYIEFVRNLGFKQMLIWACPPLAGDDYILYCHPSKQKVPRSDRLRAWYLDMLRRAREEGTVVGMSTLFDSYFEGGRDHRMERCSATLLPYLEGDFWPGEAENLLATTLANPGPGGGSKSSSKGGGGGGARGKGGSKGKQRQGPEGTLDQQLMAKLGETLGGNMKDDFMVVHMREPCSTCRAYVNGGVLHRYTPPPGAPQPAARAPAVRSFEGIRLDAPGGGPGGQVANFQICGPCFSAEMARLSSGQRPRLPDKVNLSDLTAVAVEEVPLQRDPDPDMECEIFETRQAFLSLCQGNHYQFDSLRRAKHSSMMVLYHLHNPNAPAWASTCNKCSSEIEAGTGYRCTTCPDFDMCGNCKAAGHTHEHPLAAHTNFKRIDETRTRLTEQERAERAAQLQKTLQLLVHACSCNNPACGSNSCRKVRQLFQHAVQCQLKVTGGCQLCKKMWCLLNLHAKSCTTTDCPVPRCRELRDLRRRQAARQDKARRMAYQQMLRNQAGGAQQAYGE